MCTFGVISVSFSDKSPSKKKSISHILRIISDRQKKLNLLDYYQQASEQSSAQLEEDKKHLEFMNSIKK